MAIIDVFTYNGELDMLKLHIGTLYHYVDKFIIVEAKTTFSGNYKPLYYQEHQRFLNMNKIRYHIVDENDQDLWDLAQESPNTQGAEHWKREFYQKESIKKALSDAKDDDIIYIGDVDEIWDPNYEVKMGIDKLMFRTYAYYLDNESSEQFWGTIVGRWEEMKDKTLNHLRSNVALRGKEMAGWHFTSMGGLSEVRRKLNDSYTQESYNTGEVQELLSRRMNAGVDYLGRSFTFKTDESHWPQYLKEHRQSFAHLCKGMSVVHSGRGRYNDD